ncbi:YidB family protein [Undibacterium sp. TS12]|uniref:YidB family protein n=1 Tax=Undibacterium sp. TS12 TaxID=2908202 RepID=UPI001F4D0B00|nr:YidB family protein [Undibacterium sp. TS12]MCH8622125.1 YidB family protein [Undibacterium sp. TS12]
MGLLDSALGMLGGVNQGNDPKSMLLQAVVGMLGDKQPGGVGGLQNLISAFHQNGLADIVQSWVGTGQNMPISAAQIQQALSGGQLQQLADAAGISHEGAASHLAEFLPGIIDHLTPHGQVPDSGNIDPASVLQQFSSLFGK